MKDNPSVQVMAQLVHATLSHWASLHGQAPFPDWEHAPDWMQSATHKSVQYALDNPKCTSGDLHEAWSQARTAEGWIYGPVKNETAKTHPMLIDFDKSPEFEKRKDALLIAIVRSLSDPI